MTSQLLLPTAGYFGMLFSAVLILSFFFFFFFDGPEYTGGIRWKNIRYQKYIERMENSNFIKVRKKCSVSFSLARVFFFFLNSLRVIGYKLDIISLFYYE